MVFWCPEEDVELSRIVFNYRYLIWFQNIKAVPIYVSDSSDDLWLTPKTGRLRGQSPRLSMRSKHQLAAIAPRCGSKARSFEREQGLV